MTEFKLGDELNQARDGEATPASCCNRYELCIRGTSAEKQACATLRDEAERVAARGERLAAGEDAPTVASFCEAVDTAEPAEATGLECIM